MLLAFTMAYFQLVLMVVIRKGLDYVFTKKELQILDDILPEFKRVERMEAVSYTHLTLPTNREV